MKELASIIIPVYNVELYLKECIDSLLNQTYKNIEILIVDDGSTDNSGKICDSYCRDPRVTVFHQSNAGVSVARNFALDQANGEYVFFVDPDDFVEPDFISCSIASLEEKNADLVIFSHTELFENSIKKIVPTKSLGLNTLEIKKKLYLMILKISFGTKHIENNCGKIYVCHSAGLKIWQSFHLSLIALQILKH